GRRLEYQVENGRYQGTTNTIGYDGIWRSPEKKNLVIEVKTTDAYRISLETIASYKRKLFEKDMIDADASILIVVGRQDTGDLEAQVRGSRHAWEVRIISVSALAKLVQLKENSEGGATAKKIRTILTPMEYTRLDDMVDVVFTTATEVENATDNLVSSNFDTEQPRTPEEKIKGIWQFTDSVLLQEKRAEIIRAVERRHETNLISKTKATLWSADHKVRLAVTISKRYADRAAYRYWYAYHPQWDEFLAEGEIADIALGCMDLSRAFCIPRSILVAHLGDLNTTTTERSTYWHLHLTDENSTYALVLPKAGKTLDLTPYQFDLAL
ncbi:MAG TPA: hypothetical protein VKB67_02225, partial [Rhizomicrobium sp.]|nr:hypothetical protein [Rhizomicrobium sp.]